MPTSITSDVSDMLHGRRIGSKNGEKVRDVNVIVCDCAVIRYVLYPSSDWCERAVPCGGATCATIDMLLV